MKIANVHTCVSNNSFDYFRKMLENYESLKSEDYLLCWHIYCVDREVYDVLNQAGAIVYMVPQANKGSATHCAAMKLALGAMRNSGGEWDLFADCDTMMVYRNWTSKVEEIIKDVDLFGSQFERLGSICCGGPEIPNMYKGKPSLTWLVVNKKTDLSNYTPTEDKQNALGKIIMETEEHCQIYGLPMGSQLLKDSAWDFSIYIYQNKLTYKCLSMNKPQQDNVKVLSNRFTYNEEYQLDDGNPIVVHARGSNRLPISHELPTEFYKNVEDYVSKL